jgi:hypothetical protein
MSPLPSFGLLLIFYKFISFPKRNTSHPQKRFETILLAADTSGVKYLLPIQFAEHLVVGTTLRADSLYGQKTIIFFTRSKQGSRTLQFRASFGTSIYQEIYIFLSKMNYFF